MQRFKLMISALRIHVFKSVSTIIVFLYANIQPQRLFIA
nr:MAG TPA: hypothetical protein [Inoviridae sp.]